MWISAAQMSLSVFRSGAELEEPTGTRGAPGLSLVSDGNPDAELNSVSNPVSLSSEKVVTVPSSSLSAYRNLLSRETTKWRGPLEGFIRTTAGVFDFSRPDFASKMN